MCINHLLKDVMSTTCHLEDYHGRRIFLTRLSVIPDTSKSATVQSSIKFSTFWLRFKLFRLTKNMQSKVDECEFANFLLRFRSSEYQSNNEQLIYLPTFIISNTDMEIYGSNFSSFPDVSNLSTVRIIASQNEHCDEINKKSLSFYSRIKN